MDRQQIIAEADRCVKCGYCLPVCPTYALSGDEGESPRGRIALIQALTLGEVDTPRLHAHLEHCLVCRACERSCPSAVRYGQLIVAARGEQRRRSGPFRGLGPRLRQGLFTILPYLGAVRGIVARYQRSTLRRLAHRLGRSIGRMDGLLPNRGRPFPVDGIYPAQGAQRGRLALFTGCVGAVTDTPALEATVRLLTALGYEVVVPARQRCCGALHRHAGEFAAADRLQRHNIKVFAAAQVDRVVAVASGCAVYLADYPEYGDPLPVMVEEIGAFLAREPVCAGHLWTSFPRRVAVHTPCSLRGLPGGGDRVFELLGRIPGIDLVPLPDQGRCCGGAGGYMLEQPELADRLRDGVIAALRESGAGLLVTSNTGCALHLGAGVRAAGLRVELLHPVELLDRLWTALREEEAEGQSGGLSE